MKKEEVIGTHYAPLPQAPTTDPRYFSFGSKAQGHSSIYVGDIDLTVNEQHLIDHFKRKYVSVTGAKIINDPLTKISRGYGFVHFANHEEAVRAIDEMKNSLIKGRPIKVSNSF
jgi:RNA recognition motif-containing protein